MNQDGFSTLGGTGKSFPICKIMTKSSTARGPSQQNFVPTHGTVSLKKVNKMLAKREKKICLQCAFLKQSTIHDHHSLSQAENF